MFFLRAFGIHVIYFVIDDKGIQPFKIGLIQPNIPQMG
jgi:hypothetical protein